VPNLRCSHCERPIAKEADARFIEQRGVVQRVLHATCLQEEKRDLGGRAGGDSLGAVAHLNQQVRSHNKRSTRHR
jgi:hypothetical protein